MPIDPEAAILCRAVDTSARVRGKALDIDPTKEHAKVGEQIVPTILLLIKAHGAQSPDEEAYQQIANIRRYVTAMFKNTVVSNIKCDVEMTREEVIEEAVCSSWFDGFFAGLQYMKDNPIE